MYVSKRKTHTIIIYTVHTHTHTHTLCTHTHTHTHYVCTHTHTHTHAHTHTHTRTHTRTHTPSSLTVATVIKVDKNTTISHKAVAGPSAAKGVLPQNRPTKAVSASDKIGLARYIPRVGTMKLMSSRYVGTPIDALFVGMLLGVVFGWLGLAIVF
jgi:hypothetical protein